jgi:hypothetical protein
MKVWTAYAGEHSARLKIIGTFEDADRATAAADLFNRLVFLEECRPETSIEFPQSVVQACKDADLTDFTPSDAPQLQHFEPITAAGTQVRVESQQTDIQALLKVLIHYGARIEIISRRPCETPSS